MPKLPGLGDVLGLLQAQTDALRALPETLVTLNRSVRMLAEIINSTGETVLAVQRMTVRLDRLMGDIEEPLRAMGPGLSRLARVLDNPLMDAVPDVMTAVVRESAPTLRQLRDTQAMISSIAGSTDRLVRLLDETGSRLSMLPGASLLVRGMQGRTPRAAEGPVDTGAARTTRETPAPSASTPETQA